MPISGGPLGLPAILSRHICISAIALDRNRFRSIKEKRADLQSIASELFLFLPRDLVMIFQSFVIILPNFSTLKDYN